MQSASADTLRLLLSRLAQCGVAANVSGSRGPDGLTPPPDCIELGRIGEPYGIKGWLNIIPHSGDIAVLKHVRQWVLQWPATPWRAAVGPTVVQVEANRVHSGRLIALLYGILDRTDAELLKGAQIWVSRTQFPPLKKGEFYWVDLIGLDVINREGVHLGTVTEVTDHGAHPILCIAPGTLGNAAAIEIDDTLRDDVPTTESCPDEIQSDNRQSDESSVAEWGPDDAQSVDERLIPFVPAYVDRVDLQARRIVVDWQPDF